MLFYSYFNDDKVPSFSLTLRSEQHTYHIRIALSDHLVIESFGTNLRKFCQSISSKYFWNNIPSRYPSKTFEKIILLCCSVLILYRGYYTVARRYDFYFLVAKQYFTHSLRSFVKYCFCHEQIKFISSSRRSFYYVDKKTSIK